MRNSAWSETFLDRWLEIGRDAEAKKLRFAWDDQGAMFGLLVERAYEVEQSPSYDGECISGW